MRLRLQTDLVTDPTTASPPAAQLGYDELPRLIALMTGDEKHSTSANSTLDVLWVLYDRVLRVDAGTADDPDRDRFLLSKGHGPMAYYAVLAAKGFIPIETLSAFGPYDSPLGHHPDRNLIPGVEISSGSLGHGLPLAVGIALGLRARGNGEPRVFCSSVTPSSTRAATTRPSPSRRPARGLDRADRGRRRQPSRRR